MKRGRRSFIASSLAITAGLSGCLAGGSGDGPGDGEPTGTTQASPEGDDTGTDLPETDDGAANFGIDHPAMAGAENDPVLGPPPNEAEMGFLLFSEPSCPYCRSFHDNTWEPMKAELIDTGRLSFMYRPYPKVREWAPQASYGLLEVWDRDQDAFVTLKEYYYNHHHDLALDPAGATATFLNENTDVDGDAVAEAIRTFARVEDLSESMDAAQSAGMTTIPGYAILREGEVIETTSGVRSYDDIKLMLGAD